MNINLRIHLSSILTIILCMVLWGCSNDVNTGDSNSDAVILENNNSESTTLPPVHPRFSSSDRNQNDILEDFEKPLWTYPSIKSEESFRSAEGVLFRKGIDKPFTGRVVERSPKGEVLLEASYLDGLPHGQQLRRFPDGAPALEAIFDRGVLSGVKTRWWTNGEIREEEYWSDGEFRGRRLWDDQGRLLKEEMIPGN